MDESVKRRKETTAAGQKIVSVQIIIFNLTNLDK
jgi:hypothetical protein